MAGYDDILATLDLIQQFAEVGLGMSQIDGDHVESP